MNIRLVAYRKATSTATSDTAYNLDLQEAPNVSLNFQFSDIKKPESRKGSYSQTFKLPFTDNNNEFFQNWYEVNLSTLVFSTRKSFDAILYVGTVPQFEGQLQLKSVYKKAEYYEVVLMSNTATLFSEIGEKKLKDVFKEDDNTYNQDLNHQLIYTSSTDNTLYNSWNATLVNTAGDLIKDTSLTPDISKIVYPLSVTQEKFYYDDNQDFYLNMSQANVNTLIADYDIPSASLFTVNFTQFRPSIQIKELFKLIIARSGFSYTSTFIDGDYFGNIFMTLGGHLEASALPTTTANLNPSGFFQVGNFEQWGEDTILNVNQPFSALVPANIITPNTNCTIPNDPDNVWNETEDTFTKTEFTQQQAIIEFKPDLQNLNNGFVTVPNVGVLPDPDVHFKLVVRRVINGDTDFNSFISSTDFTIFMTIDGLNNEYSGGAIEVSASLTNMTIGESCRFYIEADYLNRYNSGLSSQFKLGAFNVGCGSDPDSMKSSIRVDWFPLSLENSYSGEVDVPACIDPNITQKDFLKDILQRFNLVVSTSPEDDTNLIIEPYNEFINGGQLKHWTEKLDLSKEIIVKDTTTLQQKEIKLSDQEDIDLYNKSIKDRNPEINVFGKLNITNSNEFAKGELKNESIFSPFINSQVFINDQEDFSTYLPNVTVQYERSFDLKDGVAEYKLGKTKPKLFYYSGTPVDVLGINGDALVGGYNFHLIKSDGIDAFNFTKYPVCSPFDIKPSEAAPVNEYTLTDENLSLYWNATPPLFGALTIFNYTNNFGNWFNNTLYGKYWKPYLDNIYSANARIMECYLNLNSVDIFNFKFNDEIFINDTYWKILTISNYQVSGEASTKVTLIKSLDTFETCQDCDYVIGNIDGSNSTNMYGDYYYMWCPEGTPNCVPDITSGNNYIGAFTSIECCECNGGDVNYNVTQNGLYPCIANANSLPLRLLNIFSRDSIMSIGQTRTLISGILAGRNNPLIRGLDTTKYSQSIFPKYGNDIIIKYNTDLRSQPVLNGENHRIVLSGNTTANTRGYAFIQGNPLSKSMQIPNNTNINIRVKGISTVIGGTSATYPLGSTEAFAYYTAFKVVDSVTTQLGTAGGTAEFSLKESGAGSVCSLYIDINQQLLRFGLDDSQTDTKRIWELSVDMDINQVANMTFDYDANWALFQNGDIIKFQNGDYLLWN